MGDRDETEQEVSKWQSVKVRPRHDCILFILNPPANLAHRDSSSPDGMERLEDHASHPPA